MIQNYGRPRAPALKSPLSAVICAIIRLTFIASRLTLAAVGFSTPLREEYMRQHVRVAESR